MALYNFINIKEVLRNIKTYEKLARPLVSYLGPYY